MIAVLDTNVLISFCLSQRGAPAQIINRWFQGEFEIALSLPLLEELERVLSYSKIQSAIRLTQEERETFLNSLKASTLFVRPQLTLTQVRDENDNRLLECALEAKASYLVSGDAHLLSLESYREVQVVDPTAFLTILNFKLESIEKEEV